MVQLGFEHKSVFRRKPRRSERANICSWTLCGQSLFLHCVDNVILATPLSPRKKASLIQAGFTVIPTYSTSLCEVRP
jgi:hypothetical protein